MVVREEADCIERELRKEPIRARGRRVAKRKKKSSH